MASEITPAGGSSPAPRQESRATQSSAALRRAGVSPDHVGQARSQSSHSCERHQHVPDAAFQVFHSEKVDETLLGGNRRQQGTVTSLPRHSRSRHGHGEPRTASFLGPPPPPPGCRVVFWGQGRPKQPGERRCCLPGALTVVLTGTVTQPADTRGCHPAGAREIGKDRIVPKEIINK